MVKKRTTIEVSVEVRDQLKELGRKGETYDQILRKLLNIAQSRE